MESFDGARRRMVDNQLRTSGITDRRLLTAMGEVPRERFVPSDREALAYSDVAHPLAPGRMLAPPAPFARLVQLAEVSAGDRVLDVGAGTGYGAAVLARLATHVEALESDPRLAAEARATLGALGVGNLEVKQGPLTGDGLAGPYDVILLEGAVAEVPQPLLAALADGGQLVALIAAGGPAVATLYLRSGAEVAARHSFNTSMPPLVAARQPEAFVF
jgi:protein-L-isoaspartate(D-aspartate) O-methyltransferase